MTANENCLGLDAIITASQSPDKATRDNGKHILFLSLFSIKLYQLNFGLTRTFILIATNQITGFKLDQTTVQVFFEYITAEQHFSFGNRQHVAIILKNLLKKIFGVSVMNYGAIFYLIIAENVLTCVFCSNTLTLNMTKQSREERNLRPSLGPKMTLRTSSMMLANRCFSSTSSPS